MFADLCRKLIRNNACKFRELFKSTNSSISYLMRTQSTKQGSEEAAKAQLCCRRPHLISSSPYTNHYYKPIISISSAFYTLLLCFHSSNLIHHKMMFHCDRHWCSGQNRGSSLMAYFRAVSTDRAVGIPMHCRQGDQTILQGSLPTRTIL